MAMDYDTTYGTFKAAQKDLSAFSGWYLVARYGFKTWSEHFGSRRHGRTYCHTSHSIEESAKDIRFELFRVSKTGRLKRLRRVTENLPEGVPFVRMLPKLPVAISYDIETGRYRIRDEVLDALIERVPDTEWREGLGRVTDHHF